MKHLLQILKDNGYEPYRCGIIFETQNTSAKEQNKYVLEKYDCIFASGNEKRGIFFYQPNYSENDFSSMRAGGLATFYVKDKDFNNAVVWGLGEYGKPPSLLQPKLNIFYDGNLSHQTQIELVLQQYDHQFVFENLFTTYNFKIKNPVT